MSNLSPDSSGICSQQSSSQNQQPKITPQVIDFLNIKRGYYPNMSKYWTHMVKPGYYSEKPKVNWELIKQKANDISIATQQTSVPDYINPLTTSVSTLNQTSNFIWPTTEISNVMSQESVEKSTEHLQMFTDDVSIHEYVFNIRQSPNQTSDISLADLTDVKTESVNLNEISSSKYLAEQIVDHKSQEITSENLNYISQAHYENPIVVSETAGISTDLKYSTTLMTTNTNMSTNQQLGLHPSPNQTPVIIWPTILSDVSHSNMNVVKFNENDGFLNESIINYTVFENHQEITTSTPKYPHRKNKETETVMDSEQQTCTTIPIPQATWASKFETGTDYTTRNDDSLFLMLSTREDTGEHREHLLKKIEKLLVYLVGEIMEGGDPKLRVMTPQWSNCTFSNEIVSMKKHSRHSKKTVQFFSKTSQHNFSVIVYLINEIYQLLLTNSYATKREIFYKNVPFLKNQVVVSSALRDICFLLGAYPWELNVHCSSKGIMAGSIILITNNDEEIDFNPCLSGMIIPSNVTEIKSIRTTAKFVLIVEKDTVFQRLIKDNIFNKFGNEMILITARGFPDINTRWLLKRIWDEFHLPTFALVDADPYGIEILCCYKYGSLSMAQHADVLAVPDIKWLGVHPSDIEVLCLTSLPMKEVDFKRAHAILNRPYVDEEIKRGLRILIQSERKSEIESLSILHTNFLVDNFIPTHIKACLAPEPSYLCIRKCK